MKGSVAPSPHCWDWPAHFGAMGSTYDERAFGGGALARLATQEIAIVLASLGEGRGRQVLDVGAGTGRVSAALNEAGWRVTAFDGSPEMLACLAERVPHATRVSGRLDEPLPFPDATFAAVVAIRVVKYVTDTTAALRELARVVEPRGAVVFDVANGRSLARLGYRGSPMGFVNPSTMRDAAASAGLIVRGAHDGPRLPHVVIARAVSVRADRVVERAERCLSRVLGPGRGARSIIVEATRRG